MSATPTMMTSGEQLREAMRRVRGTWRRRVVLEGAVVALAVVLVVLAMVLAVVNVQGVRPGSIERARALVWLSLAGAAGWWILRPALRRVDDARLALYLDEHDPALAQSVLSAVQETFRPIEQQLSPALTARLATSAIGALERLDHGGAVEQPRTVVAGKRLAALLGAAAVALLLLPSPWQATARAVLMPWDAAAAVPVRSIAVLPGDVTVPRGASLDLEADLSGFATTDAELVLIAEDGGELVRLPMEPDTLGQHFGVRLFDISRDLTYWVESGGVRSERHQITVTDLPAVRELALGLDYPGYTGLASEIIAPGGDVAAVVGTEVTVTATITMPVREGVIRFDDGMTVPMSLDNDGQPVGRFRVATTGFYTVDLITPNGTTVPGTVRNLVDALPDRAPTVRITSPGRDTKPTSVEEVVVEVRADDDYGVRTLELVYTVNGGPEQRRSLVTNGRPGLTEPRAVHTLFLEELPLVPGDLVAYHALAIDGGGNTARSDLYFLEIRPFSRNYRQAEAGGAGGEGGEGGEAQSPEALSARQRELVVATFNALRDSATTSPARSRQDQTTIALAQGKLRVDVTALGAQVTSRRVAELDSTFVIIRTALDSAAAAMGVAEEALGRGAVRAATPAQQRALQQLQRAEAAYREVEVQMGGGEGGGGGGGGGAAPEELADLFELQTDRLQNQYEAIQQQATAAQAGAREVDEAQERLRDLARRAQAENERARRMAEALQQRLGEQGGGGAASGGAAGAAGAPGGAAGGGQAQRQLAAEAEAEARRLERLAREQSTPALEEAARQARQAADQLRRAAAGDPARGGEAVEALRRAGQSVAQGREGAAREAIEGLAEQAQRMGQRQREIGADAIALPPSGNAARGAALAELDRRKLELARDVRALDDAIAGAEVNARREASGASEGLAGARETIREGELSERITYSQRVARTASPEYVRNFEEQIGAYLEQVEQQLREAAGAVGTSSARRQERALEQARELTRAAQAMRERGEQGQRGEGGEQGQAQGRGQGGEGEQQGQVAGQGQAGQRGEMPGQGPRPGGGGDARQLSGEARARRQTAESLRGELAQMGVTLPELTEAIDALRRLEGERALADPRNLAALQEAVAASLQRVEFELWRRFGTPAGSRPAAGVAGDAPAAYRALVEEYFRTIARDRR